MLYLYFKKCAGNAWHGSIDSAFNWGSVIGVGFLGIFTNLWNIEVNFPKGWHGSVISYLVYAGIAWIVIYLARFLIIAPYFLWKGTQKTIIQLEKMIPNFTTVGNEKNTPSIIIGNGSPYENTTTYQADRLNRVLLIGIKNNNSAGFLTNCKLYLDHRLANGSLDTILLADTFDLSPNNERYIQVASYNEAIQKQAISDEHINLCMIHRGFFGYGHMPSADKKHIITLRLETLENIMVKANCYLWVDKCGKLKLEKT